MQTHFWAHNIFVLFLPLLKYFKGVTITFFDRAIPTKLIMAAHFDVRQMCTKKPVLKHCFKHWLFTARSVIIAAKNKLISALEQLVNPLTPRRTQVSHFQWNFNSILRRDHQKNSYEHRAYESVDEKSLS